MKKLLFAVLLTSILALSACGKVDTANVLSGQSEKQTGSEATSNASSKVSENEESQDKNELTIDYFIDSMGKKVAISQTNEKAAEMVGAKSGIGFIVGDNSFEIYEFDNEAQINEAKAGKLKLTIEGFGEFERSSSVNDNFVILYEKADEAVINAFKEVK